MEYASGGKQFNEIRSRSVRYHSFIFQNLYLFPCAIPNLSSGLLLWFIIIICLLRIAVKSNSIYMKQRKLEYTNARYNTYVKMLKKYRCAIQIERIMNFVGNKPNGVSEP